MHKTYTIPRVIRTWVLLFSVPLYVGSASLWMKEEIKLVLAQEEKSEIISIEENVQKTFTDRGLKEQLVLMP